MRFIEEFYIDDFNSLFDICWGGALQQLREIEDTDFEDDFVEYLRENFFDSDETYYTTTELNDFIWFECDDWIEEHKESDDE